MLPTTRRLLLRDAYCSVPPIESSFRPPPLSRETEAVRPCALLQPTKREMRESEASSAEFILDEEDVKVKVEAPVNSRSPADLRHLRAARVGRSHEGQGQDGAVKEVG